MLGFGSGRFRRRALFAPTFRWLFGGLLRRAGLQRCPDPACRHGAAGELANRLNSGNAIPDIHEPRARPVEVGAIVVCHGISPLDDIILTSFATQLLTLRSLRT